jgi:hypothetical protein
LDVPGQEQEPQPTLVHDGSMRQPCEGAALLPKEEKNRGKIRDILALPED